MLRKEVGYVLLWSFVCHVCTQRRCYSLPSTDGFCSAVKTPLRLLVWQKYARENIVRVTDITYKGTLARLVRSAVMTQMGYLVFSFHDSATRFFFFSPLTASCRSSSKRRERSFFFPPQINYPTTPVNIPISGVSL